MSQENLELVRSIIDAHERGDFAAVFAAYDPEIEWSLGTLDVVAGFERVYHGHEGVRSFWRQWFDAWEIAEFDYKELIEAGDHVVAILSQRMRGRESGLELEWPEYVQVWTLRSGKVVKVEFFRTREEALAAVES